VQLAVVVPVVELVAAPVAVLVAVPVVGLVVVLIAVQPVSVPVIARLGQLAAVQQPERQQPVLDTS
jgi:hypothetical protein